MFKELFPMAAKGSFSLLLSAEEGSGLMTVVVVPKGVDAGKEEPALVMPLKLTATAEELDAGFVQAVLGYAARRASLDEQVAATNEVLDAAKAASVKKGAEAVAKAGAKPPAKSAAKSSVPSDDDADDEVGEAGGAAPPEATATPGGRASANAAGAGAGVPDLFEA